MNAALDAWAIVAFLHGEPSAPRVRAELEAGAIASWVNLGEVLYIEARHQGFERAAAVVDSLAEQLVRAEAAEAEMVRQAAEIKADGGISYADCFAVATAERHGVPLLSGDPEILRLERPALELVDLRNAEPGCF